MSETNEFGDVAVADNQDIESPRNEFGDVAIDTGVGRAESLFREMTGETERIGGASLKAEATGKEWLKAYEVEPEPEGSTIRSRLSREWEQLKATLAPGDIFGEEAE